MIWGAVQSHWLAIGLHGTQDFLQTLGVLLDQLIGDTQHPCIAAVILLELVNGCFWVIFLEVQNVLNVRATKAVNAVVNQHPLGDVRVHRFNLEIKHWPVIRLAFQ